MTISKLFVWTKPVKSKRLALTSTLFFFLILTNAYAEKATPGIYLLNSFGSSYHPLGILLNNELIVRTPLSKKTGQLWESTRFEAGLTSSWTPADELLGLRLYYEPIAFFSVTGSAGFYGLYNTLGYGFYPFSSAVAPYGPDLPKDTKPQSASGGYFSIAPEIKLKAGPVILVNKATLTGISLNRDGYFLEMRSFSLHKTRDINIINEATVLYEFTKKFLAGTTYQYLDVFGTRIESHRVSALAIALFPGSRIGNAFSAFTIGYYPVNPAFNNSLYAGMMVGSELKWLKK